MSRDHQEWPVAEYFSSKSYKRHSGDDKVEAIPPWCEIDIKAHAEHFETRFNRVEWNECICFPSNAQLEWITHMYRNSGSSR